MRLDRNALAEAISDLGQALESTDAPDISLATAWQQLQETDDYGLVQVRPYTPEALATLEALYERHNQDVELIHHLAIAHHARAWDLELRDDPAAFESWLAMFEYWARLKALNSFWERRTDEAVALGADPAVLEDFRDNLLSYLIEIHIDFIKQFPHKAREHIELIYNRAPIPPAIRKQVPRQVYEVMTATLAEVENRREFLDALAIVARFLEYFPDDVPALQEMVNIAQRAIDTPLVPQEDYQLLLDIADVVGPCWDRLDQHPDLTKYPLARPSLGDLASALGQKLFFVQKHVSEQIADPVLTLRSTELLQQWFTRADF